MNRDYRLYLEDILEAIRRIERYVEGLDFDRFRMVNPKIPSTMDAANLSKMADRGQIYGGIVDGPLALDNAISLEAARIKGIRGEVAGRADILIAPDLEAGNALAKAIIYFAHSDMAGVVVGAEG